MDPDTNQVLPADDKIHPSNWSVRQTRRNRATRSANPRSPASDSSRPPLNLGCGRQTTGSLLGCAQPALERPWYALLDRISLGTAAQSLLPTRRRWRLYPANAAG